MAASAPHTVAFAVRGPITREDLPGLCERVCAMLTESRPRIALCDVGGVEPDAVTVDALARLQLAAGRIDCQVLLRHASDELLELVAFMGLTDVLPDRGGRPMSSRPGRGHTREPATARRRSPMTRSDSRKIFVNLAVKDLDTTVGFFTKLGFTFDPRFTDENATCMIVSDEAFVMLLVESRFKDFTKKELADPRTQTEAILALSAESREQVDELADIALEAGGSPANDPMDYGFMYGRSFQDPDGHIWEVFWMNPSEIEQTEQATAQGGR
jgi:predicted lactoylglutathione lyase